MTQAGVGDQMADPNEIAVTVPAHDCIQNFFL